MFAPPDRSRQKSRKGLNSIIKRPRSTHGLDDKRQNENAIEKIEEQYVRNLQQQLQLLEMENAVFRDELQRARSASKESRHEKDNSDTSSTNGKPKVVTGQKQVLKEHRARYELPGGKSNPQRPQSSVRRRWNSDEDAALIDAVSVIQKRLPPLTTGRLPAGFWPAVWEYWQQNWSEPYGDRTIASLQQRFYKLRKKQIEAENQQRSIVTYETEKKPSSADKITQITRSKTQSHFTQTQNGFEGRSQGALVRAWSDVNVSDVHTSTQQELIRAYNELDMSRAKQASTESVLAESETKLARSQVELWEARREVTEMRMKMDEKPSASTNLALIQLEHNKQEISTLVQKTRSLQQEKADAQNEIAELKEQLLSLQQAMRESDLHAKKEKDFGEKILQDNDALIEENAQLASLVEKCQNEHDSLENGLQQTKDAEKVTSLQCDLAEAHGEINELIEKVRLAESRMHNYSNTITMLKSELAELQQSHKSTMESRSQTTSELSQTKEKLAITGSELRKLKDEKWHLMQKLEKLASLIKNKEIEVDSLKDRMRTMEMNYHKLVKGWQRDADTKSLEFEQLAAQVFDVSQSIRQKSITFQSTTQQSNYEVGHNSNYRNDIEEPIRKVYHHPLGNGDLENGDHETYRIGDE